MFKNEGMIIKEWLDHYISEGIQHFYLIDNGSTDNYKSILDNYINKITLIEDSTRDQNLTQYVLFNKHFLDLIKKESEWIIVADFDEYIYSRKENKTILDYINTIPENIKAILLPWKNFGSNNIINHPESIIATFIMRENENDFKKRVNQNWYGHCKSLTKTEIINKLNVHTNHNISQEMYFSDFTLGNFELYDINKQNIHINHYQHMSYEYYTKIKIIRGDAQNSNNGYNLKRFYNETTIFNSVEDIELYLKKDIH
jgi:hypothetical protein